MNTGEISDRLISYIKQNLRNTDVEYSSDLEQLHGGYETSTYAFQLRGAGDALSNRLVLRVYPLYYGSRSAIWESTVQNALFAEGFPVARVHFVCTDTSVLDGAFIIMDHIAGQLLMYTDPETMPAILGTTHADLHNIDPTPLMNALNENGITPYAYGFGSRFDWLKTRASDLPWIAESVDWLISNRPAEPSRLSICHGDFHALNILVADGRVTGVLDWPAFTLADPALDVANTIMLTTIPARHLAASMEGLASVDWNRLAESYLAAYRARRQLDSTNLDYYRVNRCVMALIQGYDGQAVWQHPLIVADLVEYIRATTGITVDGAMLRKSV